MEVSFVNIEKMIDARLASNVNQNMSNPSFSAPSPVPVRLSPSQGRQDPSLPSPYTGYRNLWVEPEEPVLAELAISSCLSSLRGEGIAVPQGIRILERGVRLSSEAVIPAASQAKSAGRSQGGGSCYSFVDAVAALPVCSWFDDTVKMGAFTLWSVPAQFAVSFAKESSVDDEDRASVASDKSPPSEGLLGKFAVVYVGNG